MQTTNHKQATSTEIASLHSRIAELEKELQQLKEPQKHPEQKEETPILPSNGLETAISSELTFRALIENSHDGITLMSPEGKMIYLSAAVKHTLGYTPEELLGTDPRMLAHIDELEPVGKILESLYPRFGDTETVEYRMKHKNGEWRWLRANITNLLHQQHINAFVFNYEDITERKKTEALIRQSERMMADAQKIAHVGSWELDITDKGFGTLRWSDETFRIFGYSPGAIEVSVKKFYECAHPEDKVFIEEATAKAFAENTRYSIDHRLIWPDGSIRWVHEDALFIPDEITGELYKLVGTVQDITERKISEDKLLKYEANLKVIFDNTEIGYIMIDENLDVVTFNPQAARWMNTVYKETLRPGEFFLHYIKDTAEAGRLKVLIKKILEGENIAFDHQIVMPDTTEVWYSIKMNPIVAHNKKVHGICISIADITLRKQQEIEREKITTDLIQRNKDLEQFTYVISHNLRSPLTNIMGLSQLLQEDGQTEDFQKMYTKQLSVSVEKMDIIIKDLNYVLQIKKEMSEVKQNIFFSDLVQDIKLSIEYLILKEDVTLVTDFTEINSLITVKSYLYSIFYNLITNSIKYRQQGLSPVIEVKSRMSAKKIELIFTDNGLGIDLKRKGKEVFGLYKRFHHHIEGKGMGLFMTKTQVESLGGSISIESELQKGTKFIISFPVV